MARKRIWPRFVLAALVGVLLCSVSPAIITALIPLKAQLSDNEFILVAKVDKLLADKPAMVLAVTEDLKGKLPLRTLPINLTATSKEAKEGKHVPLLLKRLAAGLPLVIFVKQRDEETFNAFAFTNGTWFQILGRKADDGSATWRFLNCEPYLRRTFKGTTAELRQTILDGLSGKKEPPPPDEKEPPGYGPEVPQKKAHASPGATPQAASVCFGVIPTLGVGAPLVILAALFPSIFGGVFLLFNRWLAFFTVISVVSLIYLFHWLCHDALRDTWWGTDDALWYILMATTFLGALWAWTRWLTWASDPALPSPGRAEIAVLGILCVSCAAMLGVTAWLSAAPLRKDVIWGLMVSFTGGIGLATVYKTYRILMAERRLTPELSIEGLILWGSLIGFAAYAAERGGLSGRETSGTVLVGQSKPGEGVLHPAEFVRTVWEFKPPGNGCFVSSATLHGEHVFIARAEPTIKKGTLYCLDRATGKTIAQFIDGGEFVQPFSSPAIADGHLYIGEGFHTDPDCKLYCLDIRALADRDPKKRKFRVVKRLETTSQTEATPVVADGSVYFGAGNDGFFRADALTLEKRARFPKDPTKGRLLRFGSTALVDGKRVYVGTGVDRLFKDPGETAIFCLDADTLEQKWKFPTDLPVWATPVLYGGRLYCGIGNGDIVLNADDARLPPEQPRAQPAGAMLCLDPQTREQLWRVDVPNGVLATCAVDHHQVYFGCRDGHVYCLSRLTGKERWKTFVGSAIVTEPGLAKCSDCPMNAALYVIATAGRVCCLDPATGRVQWTFSLEDRNAHLASSPRVEVIATPQGDRRRIYFGTALGDGPYLNGAAVAYCLEDRVKEP